ncbi:MAG: sulfatase [Planctomycetes bacterium]|nr:sulfatase [Planctomycetota bacterium]
MRLLWLTVATTLIGALIARPQPRRLVTATETGVFRLDDLLPQAEVEGLEVPLHSEEALTLSVIDATKELGGFVADKAGAAGARAGLVQQEGYTRVFGGFGASCTTRFLGIREQDLGLVVLRVRAKGIAAVSLALRGATDNAQSTLSIAQQLAQGGLLGTQIPVVADEQWHTIAQTTSGLDIAAGATLERLTLGLVATAAGAYLDVEWVHLLEARAPYVHAVAGPVVFRRDYTTRSGMFLNSPATVTYAMQVPPQGRFLAELSGLNDQPFTFRLELEASGKATSLLERQVNSTEVTRLDVDLAAWSGQQVNLRLQVVEDVEPVVALLFHPLVRASRSATHRNTLLYFCDTLRADALSSNGNPRATTPCLDQLAATGIRFERCFSQAPWTYVSVPSAHTSLQPTASGVRGFGDRLPDAALTLAEVFRAAGYVTAAFACNPLVGSTTGLEQGFDLFVEPPAITGGADTWATHGSPILTRLGLELLDRLPGVPVFLYLHVVDPHAPYNPQAPFSTRYASEDDAKRFAADMKTANGSDMTPVVAATRAQMAEKKIDCDRFARTGRGLYDAEVAAFDLNFGELLSGLKERGLYDDLVLSFNSDHGEEFLEHGGTGHGQSLFVELIHVPWILKAPSLEPVARSVADHVSNLDLAPTLLAFAGLSVPECMQGRDLKADLCAGGDVPAVPIISEFHGLGVAAPSESLQGRSFAVLENGWKTLIHYPGSTIAIPGTARPPLQMFDLAEDPGDTRDVAGERIGAAESTRSRLETFLSRQNEIRNELGTSADGTMSGAAAALQALGYGR